MAFKMKTPYNFFGNLVGGLAGRNPETNQNPQANQPFMPSDKQPPIAQAPIAQSPLNHAGHGKGSGWAHHGGGGVTAEEGTKEHKLQTTRSKLVAKQRVKKKGGLGHVVRKARLKRIKRKLAAETPRGKQPPKTKTVSSAEF